MKSKILFSTVLLFLSFQTKILAQGPETNICMVTVDETYTFNKVIWEEAAQTSVDPIDSMRIYRKNVFNTYDLIGVVAYNGNGEFSDLVANPNTQSHTYKIQGVDENGVVGPMSDSSSTIHLSLVENLANNSIELNWTGYEGDATFNFYQCWDVDFTTGGKVNVNNTNDLQTLSWVYPSLTQGVVYDIVVDTDETSTTCSSTFRANYNNTRSNRSSITFGGGSANSSIDEQKLENFSLYPNPSNGVLNVNFSSSNNESVDIKIIDLSGKLVYQHDPIITSGSVEIEMDVTYLRSGVYMLIIDNGFTVRERLTIK